MACPGSSPEGATITSTACGFSEDFRNSIFSLPHIRDNQTIFVRIIQGPGANCWDSYDRVSKGSLRARAPRESSSSASCQVDASEKKQNRELYERDKPEFLVQKLR